LIYESGKEDRRFFNIKNLKNIFIYQSLKQIFINRI
jgi:hypothetical protein